MKNAPDLPEVQEGPKFRKLRFNPETELASALVV